MKNSIYTFFETENYLELYQVQAEVINEMLAIDNQQEFEDFLESEDYIEEDVFWLHYAVVHGESLLIGGYEEDVTQKISDFLKQRLPEELYFKMQEYLIVNDITNFCFRPCKSRICELLQDRKRDF